MSKYISLNDANKKHEEKQAATQSTGAADAGKIIATNAQGQIDPSFLADTEVIVREASEDLDTRDVVNVFDDLGTAKVRKADGSAYNTRAMGIVINNYLTGENAAILSEGVVGGFAGLIVGDPVFLDAATPGEITQVPPTASGAIWQKLGVAVSATELRIEIGEAITRV